MTAICLKQNYEYSTSLIYPQESSARVCEMACIKYIHKNNPKRFFF